MNLTSANVEGSSKNDHEKIEFEYFDKEGFKDFLY